MGRKTLASVLLTGALTLAGCGGGEVPTAQEPVTTTENGGGGRAAVGAGEGGVALEEIGSFDSPTYITQPPEGDGSLYVVEQTGKVQRIPPEGGEPEVFLDLSGEISCCGEQGLFSIAFAPDYERSGLFYASFTDAKGESRIVEHRAEGGGRADAARRRELLAIDQPYDNHDGGLRLFGPDGYLYAGYGDGGSSGDPERRGQDVGTLLGKLLRIDPRKAGG